MALIDNPHFKTFLFQLALVQTFKIALRKRFWSDVRANTSHLNSRFQKGIVFKEYESDDQWKISYTIYIDYPSSSVIVTFPGTSNAKQVGQYVTVRETPMPWSSQFSAQKGFLDLYSTIRNRLKSDLTDALLEFAGFPIVFNGWSLGGSLCRIAAWDFLSDPSMFHDYFTGVWGNERNREETVYVVSWGAPKAFSIRSANEYTKRFLESHPRYLIDHRYETFGVPITSLPPNWTGFRHVGTRLDAPNHLFEESAGFLGFGRHFRYSLNTPFMFSYYEKTDHDEEA